MNRRDMLALTAATTAAGCAALPPDEIARRWPPLGQVLQVDGLAVHAWVRGTGPDVVLIHGANGNLRDFTFDLAPRLANRFRVIAFDRPGFGYSARLPEQGWTPARQAAHLARAAQALTVRDPVVVGHSWGGAVALAWALDHPVRGAVTLGGALMPWGGDVSLLYRVAAGPFGAVAAQLVSAFASGQRIEGFIADTFAPQAVPAGYAAYIGSPLTTRPGTVRDNARDITRLNGELTRQSQRYNALTTPVEILHGTADTTVSPDIHAKGAHARLPNSRLTLMPGIGHMPHHADPGAAIAAISRLHR